MELPDGIDGEKILNAIRDGVRDAVWRMITNASSEPTSDFYEAVKDGVKAGVDLSMPRSDEILKAIYQAHLRK